MFDPPVVVLLSAIIAAGLGFVLGRLRVRRAGRPERIPKVEGVILILLAIFFVSLGLGLIGLAARG